LALSSHGSDLLSVIDSSPHLIVFDIQLDRRFIDIDANQVFLSTASSLPLVAAMGRKKRGKRNNDSNSTVIPHHTILNSKPDEAVSAEQYNIEGNLMMAPPSIPRNNNDGPDLKRSRSSQQQQQESSSNTTNNDDNGGIIENGERQSYPVK
jgi:hypothetical protein